MDSTQLLSYQIEYESTEITIDELCYKYDIKKKDLKGHKDWEKPSTTTSEEIQHTIVPTTTSTIVPATTEHNSLIEDIMEFKRLALAQAMHFIKEEAKFAEVKEFKDIVSIVDSIDKSLKDTIDTGPTVNIMVQNIVEKFKDDC